MDKLQFATVEILRWITRKINAKDKTFSKSEESNNNPVINYRNETQAIDSEKQFIENKVIKFKL